MIYPVDVVEVAVRLILVFSIEFIGIECLVVKSLRFLNLQSMSFPCSFDVRTSAFNQPPRQLIIKYLETSR